MAPSTPTTKDIADAWANFYTRYKISLGGGSGPKTTIQVARKEWSVILDNLRGGRIRHWPTEPDEIRQIQELLHWEQCDMWGAIDGTTRVSAHHTRTTTSHSTYTSFQGWASEVKGRWNDKENMGTRIRSAKPQTHKANTNTGGGEPGLRVAHPFLVPFAPLYEELNGTLDSEERKHFAVIKSVERQGEFYSMAQDYSVNMQNELKEVQTGAERKELYQRYANSLLILATKSYDEWTKDVLDWTAEPTSDARGAGDDNASDDNEDEPETMTQRNSPAAAIEVAEIFSDMFEEAHLHSTFPAEFRHEGGAYSNMHSDNTTPKHASDGAHYMPPQVQIPCENQPEAPGTIWQATYRPPKPEFQPSPGAEYGKLWPSDVLHPQPVHSLRPSTQFLDSMVSSESQSQQEPKSHHWVNVGSHAGLRGGGLEPNLEHFHTKGTQKTFIHARSLSAEESLHPARAHVDPSDEERKGGQEFPVSATFPHVESFSMSHRSSFSNTMYRAGSVPFPEIEGDVPKFRTVPSATQAFLRAVPMRQPSVSYPPSTRSSQTLYSPPPRRVYIHSPGWQAPRQAKSPSVANSPGFQHGGPTCTDSRTAPPFNILRQVATAVDVDASIIEREQDERKEELNADGERVWGLKLMEEGRAGYLSESFVHNNSRGRICGGGGGLRIHDVESISDISISDISSSDVSSPSITESEGEESDTPTPSLTPTAFNYVPKVDKRPRSTSRLASSILRGAKTGTSITCERSVQFRNSPEVRYF